jgi:bis(5'-nucleosyl)-tetraphosphatase (symmetrical)
MILLVGDIQGCDDALQQLLDVAGFSPSRDHLVALGDLVNRGPQSLAVLQRLMALGSSASCVLGNHDLHLLAVSQGVRPPHRQDTLQPVLAHPQAAALLDWLRQRPLLVQQAGWVCVHAGLPPDWTLEEAQACADELAQHLRSPGWATWLRTLFGNEPRRWSPGLQGPDRWRYSINALTRMRLCEADGALDFKLKEGLAEIPAGYTPWFDAAGRRNADTAIAFGHWSTLGLVNRPTLLGLDTGCVWGGALSAARIDGGRREIVQVVCKGFQQPG